MIRIVIGSVMSRIDTSIPADVSSRLNEDLRYHPDGYQHTWYFKNKKWDGYNYCYNMVERTFRTGLLWRVCLRLQRDNLAYDIVDERPKPEKISGLGKLNLGNITPFHYQIDAAESTGPESHCIVASPTGTGKTIMMSLMVQKHQLRTLIVVNSRTLLDQTHEFFEQVVPGTVGIVGSGDFDLGDVTIATIQSLSTILRLSKKQQEKAASWKEEPVREWLANVGLVIHDEVHEADNASVDKLYGQLPASKFIGMTATPYAWAHATEKGKNLEMEQHFGRKVFDSRGEVDFIKLGITVPLIVNRPLMPRASEFVNYVGEGVRKFYGVNTQAEYRDVVKVQVDENQERIDRIAKIAAGMVDGGMSCYVFYNKIAYGEALCEAMKKYDPVMLQGSTSRNERNQVFKDINEKRQLLVVSDIGSYGLNIRSLDNIIIASPTKDARQLKGRVCRAFEGKKYGLVTDLVDNVPYLDKHAELRLNQYNKDGDAVVG